MKIEEITKDMIEDLMILCESDRWDHFTERGVDYSALEKAELIEICKPTHYPSGIEYGCDEWGFELTDLGLSLVEENSSDCE